MIKINVSQVRLGLDEQENSLPKKLSDILDIPEQEIQEITIEKMSVDARKKSDIYHICTIHCAISDRFLSTIDNCKRATVVIDKPVQKLIKGTQELQGRPVIIGAGPCGLFSAYLLAQEGYAPIILERGKPVEQRVKDIEYLWQDGVLDENSNVVFGEGGAGTFSDGKLTWRGKDDRGKIVLGILIECGAPKEILFQSKPHIGSDILRKTLICMRQKIEAMGGTFCFEHQVTNWYFEQGKITGVSCNYEKQVIDTNACVIAIGHSARDTFSKLYSLGVMMEAKPFAVGFRIEHLQKDINESQFGKFAEHPKLGAAEYQLSTTVDGRGIYSFCMCPGGQVICSSSEMDTIVCNGMSLSARDQVNANSAIVVQVSPKDFGENALGGVDFQRNWEKLAYQLGGGQYIAPAQRVGDFLADRETKKFGRVKPSYLPGVRPANLSESLPDFCIQALRRALPVFGRKIRGFDHADAVLTGIETRTSSPMRIMRNDWGVSISHDGLYPAGEGAGYAGGIMSAAVDGLKVAEQIIERFSLNG